MTRPAGNTPGIVAVLDIGTAKTVCLIAHTRQRVFHHIDHAEHVSLLRELHRVIRPGGSLFIFEHNPYNPLTVRVVNSCPFDANAKLIRGSAMKSRLASAGFDETAVQYRIFFPHALKALRPLEMSLKWLPLGGQYYTVSTK